jgi:ribonuclease J
VIVNIIIDENDEPLGDPWCETMGLSETGRSKVVLVDVLEADLGQFLMRADDKTLRDDERLEKELKRIVRQVSQSEIGKKPEVTIITSRLA